ncbi:unnamed protein product [Auanema sp. JU1783]|nr:unnamed protein product [Auanema sp. JU1783]
MTDIGRSLRECLLEAVDDLESITKQIIESLLNRDKHHKGNESMSHLVQLFESKQQYMKKLLEKASQVQERENLIRSLEECVENRNEIIENLEANLKVAEVALTAAVFQANKKLHSVRTAEAHPIDSEEVIRFAHQISKSYSVAAPLFWQQGDPSRPFPTEPEFRNSQLAAPRTVQQAHPISMLRQQSASQIRTPPIALGRGSGSSPMTNLNQQKWSGNGSPRFGYQQTTSSPRGRGTPTMGWNNRPGHETSPYPWGQKQNSPHLTSPSVTVSGMAPRKALAVNTVQQMSSGSSSSSSSDDESPK